MPIAANGLVNIVTSGHLASPFEDLWLSAFNATSGYPAIDDLQALL
jgi:hypothetical protein